MTKEEIIKDCLDNHTGQEILEAVDEAKHNYIDSDDIEEYGDVYEAYEELGRGEAESAIMMNVMKPWEQELKGNLDLYCEIWDNLCEEWNISTN